jgi:hypothetical protein
MARGPQLAVMARGPDLPDWDDRMAEVAGLVASAYT